MQALAGRCVLHGGLQTAQRAQQRPRRAAPTPALAAARAPLTTAAVPSRRPGALHGGLARRGCALHATRERAGASSAALEQYSGRYGSWTLTDDDRREVWAYRACLAVVAAAFDAGAVATLLPEDAQRALLDPAWFVGAAGLGGSLYLVHMYVTPIKRTMQALWAAGLLGSLAVAATQDGTPVAAAVYAHKELVWAVGPLFAALTGLCFKEGACYGKAESALLFFLFPALLLSHLAGAPDAAKAPMLVAATGLVTLWAARKWTQAIKDDIGDKSVFDFMALSPEEQQRREAAIAMASWSGVPPPRGEADDAAQ